MRHALRRSSDVTPSLEDDMDILCRRFATAIVFRAMHELELVLDEGLGDGFAWSFLDEVSRWLAAVRSGDERNAGASVDAARAAYGDLLAHSRMAKLPQPETLCEAVGRLAAVLEFACRARAMTAFVCRVPSKSTEVEAVPSNEACIAG